MEALRLEIGGCEARAGSDGPGAVFAGAGLAFLNHLRFVSMGCRVRPRTDLFRACALLHGAEAASQAACSEALMRCLGEALGKPARLFAPGTAELTFDEQWLVRLAQSCARGDQDSVDFLLRSRVGAEHRRLVRFLVARVSESFPLV